MSFIKYIIITTLPIAFFSCKHDRYPGPLSPQEEIRHFDLVPGLSVELFASEPQVLAPVDMVFDEQGVIYVMEMADYPDKAAPGKGKGRIRVLKDTDHDGKIDTAVIYADGLASGTSMLPWKGGLIVTAAPDILYLKDTTGDFRADSKEVLFTGFFASNSEAQITSLRFGIDNWIYANNHGQDGEVKYLRRPEMPALRMGGSDFRFRLDRGLFEKVSGSGQFGMAMDDWGHRFYTQNTLHIQQAPIAWKYMHRHEFLPSDNADVNISDHESAMFQQTPPPYWRLERSNRRQKDYDELKLDRKEYAAGHFTGASGGTFYGGDLLPDQFRGAIFTGDVAGNLVHRDVIVSQSDNAAFVAKRGGGEQTREFLASTDPWFRPANFSVGPDGSLFVIDMYRQHIETPVSIPDDLKEDMNFTNGEGYGRIFRIVPSSHQDTARAPELRNERSDALVALLAHPAQWWRLQAQRLLLERQDKSVVPALQQMFMHHANAKTRMHALYALEGLNALNESLIKIALQDSAAGVREKAIVLSDDYPGCFPLVLKMINDPSRQVGFQAALSIGNHTGPQVIDALAEVVRKYGDSALFRTAVLSSDAGSSPALYSMLIAHNDVLSDARPGIQRFTRDIFYVNGARNKPEEIIAMLDLLSTPALKKDKTLRNAALAGLTKGLKSVDARERAQGIAAALSRLDTAGDPELGRSVDSLKMLIQPIAH